MRQSCPEGWVVSGSDHSRLFIVSNWEMPHFQHDYVLIIRGYGLSFPILASQHRSALGGSTLCSASRVSGGLCLLDRQLGRGWWQHVLPRSRGVLPLRVASPGPERGLRVMVISHCPDHVAHFLCCSQSNIMQQSISVGFFRLQNLLLFILGWVLNLS